MAEKKWVDDAITALDSNNYVPMQSFESKEQDFKALPKELVNFEDPEALLAEKERHVILTLLSKEAQQVVEIITECPQEILEAMGYKNKKETIGLSAIKRYFKWPDKKYNRVINEVATYTTQLENL
jgi:transposase